MMSDRRGALIATWALAVLVLALAGIAYCRSPQPANVATPTPTVAPSATALRTATVIPSVIVVPEATSTPTLLPATPYVVPTDHVTIVPTTEPTVIEGTPTPSADCAPKSCK